MINLTCDIHGFLDQTQYIDNTVFQQTWDTINKHLTIDTKNCVTINLHLTLLSVNKFDALINAIYGLRKCYETDQRRIFFTLITSKHPIWLQPSIFSKDKDVLEFVWAFMLKKRQETEKDTVGFTSQEMDVIQYEIDRYENNNITPNQLDQYRKLFFQYTQEQKLKYNRDFCTYFPELVDFYNECKKCYTAKI